MNVGKEQAAQAMSRSVDVRRANPIVSPIVRSDNPYLNFGGGRECERSAFKGAALSLLSK